MTDRTKNGKRPAHWLLRRMDQAVVGALVFFALVALSAYWLVQGAVRGRLIELDSAPRRPAAYVVDVNQADWPELAQLPGIGETLARRIVESRDADGAYADLEELRRVRGIGPRTLKQLRPFLRPLAPASDVAGK